jgi:AcrR family transcriptional regulator
MTAIATDPVARPLRRDAVRNQQRVLSAARAALAEHGTDVTMELIALRAGVGVGTVYRNFATKDALIDELVRLIFDDLVASARAAADRADGTGLEEFLWVLGGFFVEHRGYAHLLVGRAPARCGAEVLRTHIGELLEQGQRVGRIGPEIRLGDIMTTIWALRGVVDTGGAVAPRAWKRHLELQLAALRAPEWRSDQPPVSKRQLARITHDQLAEV